MKLRITIFLYLLALAIGASPPGFAQSGKGPFTISSGSSPCARIGVTGQGSVVAKITGTFSMTLQPELAVQGQTPDNAQATPSTSQTAQSTITAVGSYATPVGSYDTYLLCVTSYVSGTATIYLNTSPIINASTLGGSAGNTSPPPTTLPAAVTSFVALGDSITLGFGLPQSSSTSPSLQAWPQLMADMFALPLTSNLGLNGAQMTGAANFYPAQAYSLTPTAAVGTVTLYGANDTGFILGSAGSQTMWENALTAMAVWLATPSTAKVLDASISYVGGGWGTNTFAGLAGHYTFEAGDTATATVNGTAVYWGGWAAGTYGSWDVTVDGVSKGNFNTAPSGNTAGGSSYPYAFRISGLSAGNHTVVLTAHDTNADTLQWFAGNGGATAPTTIFLNTIPQTGVSSGNLALIDACFTSALPPLASDGLNVFLVNAAAALSLTASPTEYQGTSPHPNMLGATLVATAAFQTLTPTVTYPTKVGNGGDSMAQILNVPSLTPAQVGSMLEALANFWAAKDQPGGFASLDANGYLVNTSFNKATNYNGIATVSNGLPSEYATVDLTAQSAALSAHTLYTPASTGMFRVCYSADITTVDSTSSTLGGSGGFQLTYTSPTDSVAKTTVAGNSTTSTANTTATAVAGCLVAYAKTSVAMTFSFGYTGGTGDMRYQIHVKVEAM